MQAGESLQPGPSGPACLAPWLGCLSAQRLLRGHPQIRDALICVRMWTWKEEVIQVCGQAQTAQDLGSFPGARIRAPPNCLEGVGPA